MIENPPDREDFLSVAICGYDLHEGIILLHQFAEIVGGIGFVTYDH